LNHIIVYINHIVVYTILNKVSIGNNEDYYDT